MQKYHVWPEYLVPVVLDDSFTRVRVYLASDVDARIAELENFIREIIYLSPTGQMMTVKADVTQMLREIGWPNC